MWKKIISIVYIFFLLNAPALAEILFEQEATPSVVSEPGALFLITEINFKNSTADWVKMKYLSPSEKPLNIKDISFADDAVFKKIDYNINISSGQELLLTFKSDQADQVPYLYTSRSGLTGTTEQFIIYDKHLNVLDAICWTTDKPTEKEIADMEKLYEKGGWISDDIFTCFDSKTVKTNESLIRISFTDTDSREDWATQTQLEFKSTPPVATTVKTPFPQTEIMDEDDYYNMELTSLDGLNTAPLQGQDQTATAITVAGTSKSPDENLPAAVNKPLTTLDTAATTKLNPSADKKSKEGSSYSNGNLSGDIIISEIMPNPDGPDTNKEWIELYNAGEKDINLGNWTLDDIEGGSKPYVISSSVTIGSGQTAVFGSKETKISLGNAEDEVRLFDFTGEMMDIIGYENAPSGKSYARITIITEEDEEISDWIWTAEPTPGEPNPSYLEIAAEITKEPQFESFYFFEARDSATNQLIVRFSEDIIAAPLAKAGFTVGTKVKLLLQPDAENTATFILKKYEIISGPPVQQTADLLWPSVISFIVFISVGIFYLLRKKFPWQDMEETLNSFNEKKEKL